MKKMKKLEVFLRNQSGWERMTSDMERSQYLLLAGMIMPNKKISHDYRLAGPC